METKKTWLITGTSQGIGLEMVKMALANGDNVAATARKVQALKNAVGISSANFLPLEVDLLDEESVLAAVKFTQETFGSIDMLVNNAGYGLMAGIEEASKKEVQANFDINVFGTLSMIRAVLPNMRKLRKGHIINISSVFGLLAGKGWGIYCATKFAMEGFSEALAEEVQPFGLKVTIIEPGYFRTNFLSSGSLILAAKQLNEYTEISEIKRLHAQEIVGNQPGDPEKAAQVIYKISSMENPPLRLLLGSDAIKYADYKAQQLKLQLAAHLQLSVSTDFE